MKSRTRAIFFWLLVLLFLIVAPSIVLYARGYRFDFHRGVFVHSGTITIKANPVDVGIRLNGKDESSQINRINSSLNVTGLLPQNYEVSVSAPDFQTWSKKADVHSGLATEFWNVLLIRNTYERTGYDTAGIDKFFISPKNDFAAWTQQQDSGFLVRLLDLDNNENPIEFAFTDTSLPDDEFNENIEWSPNENFLSVPAVMKERPVTAQSGVDIVYFILDPDQKTAQNFNEFIGIKNIRGLRWDPQEKYFLFFLSDNSLFRADIRDKNSLKLIADEVSSFELSRSHIYYTLRPNEIIYRSNFDGDGDRLQITESFPENYPQPTKKLIIYDELRIAYLDQTDNLYIFNGAGEQQKYFRKIGESIKGMQFSDDGKKLLYWKDNEIFVYFLTDWKVQPNRSEDEIQNITRYSEPIKNIQWFKDYEHVIFTVSRHIKIIELDPRDRRNCMDITAIVSDRPKTVYNNSLEKLFFIDQEGDSGRLFSLSLPEKTGLFGFAR